eukprot:GHVS01077643.1.p1 GENE.GHVS01077643.1~~GHVS01077643.1.p1  ORF type:complete len:387 (-),score=56.47 GHVS01077643.1:659-1819(-)
MKKVNQQQDVVTSSSCRSCCCCCLHKRISPKYTMIYTKSTLSVFSAIVNLFFLLFVFFISMPVVVVVEAVTYSSKTIEEEMKDIEKSPFMSSGVTLTTYGDVAGCPVPVIGYVKQLEQTLQEYLHQTDDDDDTTDNNDNRGICIDNRDGKNATDGSSSDGSVVGVMPYGIRCREIINLLTDNLYTGESKLTNRRITDVEFDSVIIVDMAMSTLSLTVDVFHSSQEDDSTITTQVEMAISAKVIDVVDSKYNINVRLELIDKIIAIKHINLTYKIIEKQSSFVESVMSCVLINKTAKRIYMAAIDVNNETTTERRLAAAGVVFGVAEDGKLYKKISGTIIGNEFRGDICQEIDSTTSNGAVEIFQSRIRELFGVTISTKSVETEFEK